MGLNGDSFPPSQWRVKHCRQMLSYGLPFRWGRGRRGSVTLGHSRSSVNVCWVILEVRAEESLSLKPHQDSKARVSLSCCGILSPSRWFPISKLIYTNLHHFIIALVNHFPGKTWVRTVKEKSGTSLNRSKEAGQSRTPYSSVQGPNLVPSIHIKWLIVTPHVYTLF